jgi:hypothetical protein
MTVEVKSRRARAVLQLLASRTVLGARAQKDSATFDRQCDGVGQNHFGPSTLLKQLDAGQ